MKIELDINNKKNSKRECYMSRSNIDNISYIDCNDGLDIIIMTCLNKTKYYIKHRTIQISSLSYALFITRDSIGIKLDRFSSKVIDNITSFDASI